MRHHVESAAGQSHGIISQHEWQPDSLSHVPPGTITPDMVDHPGPMERRVADPRPPGPFMGPRD